MKSVIRLSPGLKAQGDVPISKGIIATIHDFGGRFLKVVSGSYHVLDPKATSKTVTTALCGGQKKLRQKIYASEDIRRQLPWLDKGQFSYESYAEYSSCIYASLLGKPRLSFSPHVAELMNLSRIGSKGIADEEEDSSGEEPKVASGVADIPRSVSPRPADEPQSTDETNSTELDTSYSTRSLDESHSTMNTAVSDL